MPCRSPDGVVHVAPDCARAAHGAASRTNSTNIARDVARANALPVFMSPFPSTTNAESKSVGALPIRVFRGHRLKAISTSQVRNSAGDRWAQDSGTRAPEFMAALPIKCCPAVAASSLIASTNVGPHSTHSSSLAIAV